MLRLLGALTALAGLSLAGTALAAPSIKIDHAVARVIVSPEARSDIKVEIVGANPRLPLRVWTFMGRTYVDGGIADFRIHGCRGPVIHPSAMVLGIGEISGDAMPQIIVHTPQDVRISVRGAVFGQLIRSDAAELANAGCGDWDVGNVRGALKVQVAGSGSVHTGKAASAQLMAAGSGEIVTREIDGAVNAEDVGSGDIDVASVNGALGARIAGSGHVRVEGGHATAVQVAIAGSGDLMLGGVADSLHASLVGSGDVHVAKVNGPVTKAIVGSGEVRIGS